MTTYDPAGQVWADVERIRSAAPLIHNITNYVVMNTTANALLALGASPVMAHAAQEVAEMAALAGALVINIGTLSPSWVDSMFTAGRAARALARPIVLDPVGAGATHFRTETARRLLAELRPAIVRGNASEIRALSLDELGTKGVDSQHGADTAMDAALDLVTAYGCVVSVSGEVDRIVDHDGTTSVFNGHRLMPRVTGLGLHGVGPDRGLCGREPFAAPGRRARHGRYGDCRRDRGRRLHGAGQLSGALPRRAL